jgi:hypothetical protein
VNAQEATKDEITSGFLFKSYDVCIPLHKTAAIANAAAVLTSFAIISYKPS